MGDISYLTSHEDDSARMASERAAMDAKRVQDEAEARQMADTAIDKARNGALPAAELENDSLTRGRDLKRETIADHQHTDFERRTLAAAGLEAPLTDAPTLNLDELKKIGTSMREQGKLFLSNDEIDETAAALRNTKNPEARTAQQAGNASPTQDSSGNTQDSSGQPANNTEHTQRESAEGMASLGLAAAVTRTVIGEGTELSHLAEELHKKAGDDRRYTTYRSMSDMEIFNRSTTEGTDDSAKEELRKRAIDATMNLSDKGDMLAASRLMDRIEHNATTQEIAAALMELENAKRAEDVTIHLRNGKTVSVVYDGDSSPEVTVTGNEEPQDYSVSTGAMDSSAMSSSFPRAGRRLVRALANAVTAATFSEAVAEARSNDLMHLKDKPVDNSNPLGLKFPLDIPPLEMVSGGMNVNSGSLQVALDTPPKGHSQSHSLPSFH